MSLYEMSEEYIQRELAKVPADQRDAKRLELDIQAILNGPLGGSRAAEIAAKLCENRVVELAIAIDMAASRFFKEDKPLGCRTIYEARERMLHARAGSLNNPSRQYLLSLQKGIKSWLAAVEKELEKTQ